MTDAPRLPFPATAGVIASDIRAQINAHLEMLVARAVEKGADLGISIGLAYQGGGGVPVALSINHVFLVPGQSPPVGQPWTIYLASSLSPTKAQRGTGANAPEEQRTTE